MDYGWDYKPYVSAAERRRNAQREIEKRTRKGQAASPVVIDGRLGAKTSNGTAITQLSGNCWKKAQACC